MRENILNSAPSVMRNAKGFNSPFGSTQYQIMRGALKNFFQRDHKQVEKRD